MTRAEVAEARSAPPEAKSRILAAAIRCLVRDGIADTTMSSIATEGDVSKALLHYHFADRAHLLAQVVLLLGRRIEARERTAMETTASGNPVDTLWNWLRAELERGELHALLTVGTVREEPVRAACDVVRERRRGSARRTIGTLFERLALSPRVPVPLIADACLIYVDGLMSQQRSAEDARLSYDIFWLAMLSLGE